MKYDDLPKCKCGHPLAVHSIKADPQDPWGICWYSRDGKHCDCKKGEPA